MGESNLGLEIPLPLSFFYLLNEAEAGFTAHLLELRPFAGQSEFKTLSGGEFGWGGTSVKP